MENANVTAFIDESGDIGLKLDAQGVSKLFILVALIVDSAHLEGVRNEFEKVRRNFYQTGEMKSNTIKNPDRRMKIIEAIAEINNYKIIAFIADKTKIRGHSGLNYRDSFRKFMTRQLYICLYEAFPGISIVSDNIGRDTFIDEFKKYLSKRANLFDRMPSFVDSKNEVLVQGADILAGTINKQWNHSNPSDDFLSSLKNQMMNIIAWPKYHPNRRIKFDECNKGTGRFDSIIQQQSIIKANAILENTPHDQDEERQLEVLEYLLISFLGDDEKLVSVKELIEHLGISDLSIKNPEAYIRGDLIAGLRSRGAIIVTGQKYGYKLPKNENELDVYIRRTHYNIAPQIIRVQKLRDTLSLATLNDYDILSDAKYSYLKQIIESGMIDASFEQDVLYRSDERFDVEDSAEAMHT